MVQNKKKYERPSMQVFKLKETPQLLQMSNPGNLPGGGNPWPNP